MVTSGLGTATVRNGDELFQGSWFLNCPPSPCHSRLCPYGRSWRPLNGPNVRPSRSGMNWPTRSPTAAAKGEWDFLGGNVVRDVGDGVG